MEGSNSQDSMTMEEDEDTDETISLRDLRLMFAKLQEIHSKDVITENEWRTKLDELKKASMERRVSRLRDEVTTIKEKIKSIKKENEVLTEWLKLPELPEMKENEKKLRKILDIPSDIALCEALRANIARGELHELMRKPKPANHAQTDLTFPPSPSINSLLSESSSSSSTRTERPFNAQDVFIEIQMARKRLLEENLKQLKKQFWYEGPEVMLVKFDAYEKLLNKSSFRRKRRLTLNSNQFDCSTEIGDNHEKRPRLENSKPPSPSSTNKNGKNDANTPTDPVVQLFFTSPPKQTNGQGSHT